MIPKEGSCSMSSSSNQSVASGEKYHMKQFIIAAQEYCKSKSEDMANLLSRYLQLLAVTLDLNTFDPNSSVVAEFYVSLHELMSGLESRSNLIWYGVSVLQQACKNPAAHKALIKTYQFVPILSKLLGEYLIREKKIKLLTLMQELTYGIKISWQVSHLPHLILTLTRWIEGGDELIIALSLGVLLNLCYKNLPVIYTLMRTVNTKHFIKTVISMKTPGTEVQICKLLIIMEHINGEIPEEDILNFIRVTFRTIVEAYKFKDLIRMRHIVEFFLDVRNQNNQSKAVAEYDSYLSDVSRVLDAVEETGCDVDEPKDLTVDHECMSLLFEFLKSLVELKIDELSDLYPRMVNVALNWIQTETVSSKALALLKSIAFVPTVKSPVVLENLASGLPMFIHMLQDEDNLSTTYDHCNKMSALLQLLQTLVTCKEVREKMFEQLNQTTVKQSLGQMLKNEELMKCRETNGCVELCVNALVLVCELSKFDSIWYQFYLEFINQKQIQMMLAKAVFMESTEMKELVFEISRMEKFPKRELAAIMGDVQPSFEHKVTNTQSHHSTNVEEIGYPIMTPIQSAQLDNAIMKFKEAIATNQISTLATSEVMELYEYKMASMAHAERAAQVSLDAANQLVTHLQHRVAQMKAEVSRLHQLLFHTQQCHEETQRQFQNANGMVEKMAAKLAGEESVSQELRRNLKDKEKELMDKSCKIMTLEVSQKELIQTKNMVTKKYEAQCEKNLILVTATDKLESNMNRLNQELAEKSLDLAKSKTQIEQLNKDVKVLEELRKQHENLILSKEKELQEKEKNIEDLKRVLEAITKLTRSKV